MSESESVWNAVRRNWEDEVWLEEVAGKFWRLTLQVSSPTTSSEISLLYGRWADLSILFSDRF